MRLSYKQLKELIVETISGKKLGHVSDVVFEIEGQLVAQYIVKSSRLSSKELIVNRNQIVRFEEKKLVVDDMVGREEENMQEQQTASSPEPIVMREEMGN